jgi:hypothetical protein
MGSISVAHKFKQKVLNFCENFTHGKTVKFLVCYNIMDKIISEAAQILQRISNGQRTQRDW